MPLYSYACPQHGQFSEIIPMAESSLPQLCPTCSTASPRQLSRPRIVTDYPGYNCPVTDRWIEGRAAHQENLKVTGSRILEPGEKEASAAYRQREQEGFENRLADTAERLYEGLPSEKREKLAAELTSGLDISYERSTVTPGV